MKKIIFILLLITATMGQSFAQVVTRSGKGSPLTRDELDNNFLNLQSGVNAAKAKADSLKASKLNVTDSAALARKTNTITINGVKQTLGVNPSFTVAGGSGGSGTVTNVTSTTTDLSVANGTTTPAITLSTVNGKPLSYFDPTSSIQTQLNGKQSTLTFDNSPTSSSTNPVTSGGVYTALSGKQNTIGYTPENQTNKVATLTNSATDYPSTSAVTTALGTYAPLASPVLTGTPTAPTPTVGDNSTKVATTAFVQTALGSGSSVNSIALTTPNLIFNTPVNFSKDASNNWTAALSLNSQTAKTVLAAPNGANGTPSFRQLVSTDLSDGATINSQISANYNAIGLKQPRIVGNKPAATGTSYSVTDSLTQILANHDNGIATNTSSLLNKQDKVISTYSVGSNTPITNTMTVPQAFGVTQGQINNLNSVVAVKQPVGTSWEDTFNRTSLGSNYTVSGTAATWTLDGTKLTSNLSASSYPNVTDWITKNDFATDAEEYTVESTVKVNTVSSSSSGIGIKVSGSSIGSNTGGFFFRVGCSNDSKNGIVFVNGDNNLYDKVYTSGRITISAGDVLTLRLVVVRNVFICYVYDQTTGHAITYVFTYPLIYPNGNWVIPQHVKFGILNMGGSYDITDFKYKFDSVLNPDYGFFGDSLTSGMYGGSTDDRFANLIGSYDRTKTSMVYARPGCISADLAADATEIAAIAPKYAFLMIGYNDTKQSIPQATTIANLTTIKNALEGAGSTVVFLSIPANSSLNAAIMSAFPSNRFIDCMPSIGGSWTNADAIAQPPYLAADNVHLTKLGNMMYARTIYAAMHDVMKINLPSVVFDGKFSSTGDAFNAAPTIGTWDNYGINFMTNATVRGFLNGNGNFRWGDANTGAVSKSEFVGSIAYSTITKTAAYTLTSSDYMVRTNASSAAFTLTLPPAANAYYNNVGRVYKFVKTDNSANAVTIQANGTEIIGYGSASSTQLTTQGQVITLQSNGTSWDIL